MNPAKIEDTLKLVLVGWIVIIAAAWLMGRLCRKIGQPPAVGEIAAGLLLGPSFIGLFAPEFVSFIFPDEVKGPLALLAKIGLLLMLFQVGMEFDFSHLRAKSKVVITSSLMGILAPLAGGLAISPWLHRTFAPDLPMFGFQLFVCIALAISALPIMGRILLEMKLERTALGATAISAAAIDDAVGWVFLGVATAIIKQGDNFTWLPFLGQTALIILYFFVLMKFVGPLSSKCLAQTMRGPSNRDLHARIPRVAALRAVCLRAHHQQARHLRHLRGLRARCGAAFRTLARQSLARALRRLRHRGPGAHLLHQHRPQHEDRLL
jgi:Kef-type K+ transport system membrane component KefB